MVEIPFKWQTNENLSLFKVSRKNSNSDLLIIFQAILKQLDLKLWFEKTRFNITLETNQVKIRALLILTPVKFHCGNDVEILTAIDSLANFPSLLPSTSIWGFFCSCTSQLRVSPNWDDCERLAQPDIDAIFSTSIVSF